MNLVKALLWYVLGSMENRYVVYVSMSGMVGTKVCVRTDNKKWNHNFKCVHIIKKI